MDFPGLGVMAPTAFFYRKQCIASQTRPRMAASKWLPQGCRKGRVMFRAGMIFPRVFAQPHALGLPCCWHCSPPRYPYARLLPPVPNRGHLCAEAREMCNWALVMNPTKATLPFVWDFPIVFAAFGGTKGRLAEVQLGSCGPLQPCN